MKVNDSRFRLWTWVGLVILALVALPSFAQGQQGANPVAISAVHNWDNGVSEPVPVAQDHECRFWGIIAENAPGAAIQDHLVNLPNSIKNLGAVNPDGWSVGYYPDGSIDPTVNRGFPPASSDPNFDAAVNEAASATPRIAVSHVRNTSSGIR